MPRKRVILVGHKYRPAALKPDLNCRAHAAGLRELGDVPVISQFRYHVPVCGDAGGHRRGVLLSPRAIVLVASETAHGEPLASWTLTMFKRFPKASAASC